MDSYVSLHTHSEYSFLDGFSKTDMIAQRAKELNQSAIALTDHGECSGHPSFQKSCFEAGVKPIFGMEGYLVDSIARVRAEKDRKNSHLLLLAENQTGLSNLWTISSRAYMEGRYYKPLADWDMLSEHSEGLIVTDGCLLAYMARALLDDNYDAAKQLVGRYLSTFGEDNFFMELHTFQMLDPKSEADRELNAQISKMNTGKAQLAQELGVPLIVVNDAHYCKPEQWEQHALVWEMNTSGGDKVESGQAAAWIMSSDEIIHYMSKHGIGRSVTEEAIKNTSWIAERCNAEIPTGSYIPSLSGTSAGDKKLFYDRCEKGFQKKVVEKGLDVDVYRARFQEEAELIESKDFCGYFNIVAFYSDHAKNEMNMLMGPSRGSAGGSLVAYLMDITELDPVRYDLLFGRFIDPGRKSNPDIDLDFPQSRRHELKPWLETVFGKENISGIGTMSRLQPRGILADLCKAMKIPADHRKEMAAIIEQVKDIDTANVDITWDEVLQEKGGDLAPWAEKYPDLFHRMGEMIGLIRQTSTHAAGVVISHEPLLGKIPLRLKGSGENAELVTQFENNDKHPDVEDIGFIKFDILGLRHLDTLTEARNLVKERHDIDIDYYNFTDEMYQDTEVWDMIAKGKTLGCFQLETPGMTAVTKRFRPLDERDVADLISVNRPGVVRAGMLQEYLARREGSKSVELVHPMLEEIVGRTFGVVVYQEQVMLIVRKLANYTMSEADKIRKIMGKMLFSEMKKQKDIFIQRCLENEEFQQGCRGQDPERIAEDVWRQIESAGIYSFNQAHAQAYALIACWGAYMKAKFPAEYLVACMKTDSSRINRYIREARRLGIAILPPDINTSGKKFSLVNEGIRYGLDTVHGVGPAAVNEILVKRPFTDLTDYLSRTSGQKARKATVVENLVSVGAFDQFGDRTQQLQDFILWHNKKSLRVAPDFSNRNTVIETEMRLVGNYITHDPFEPFIEMIEGVGLESPDLLWASEVGDLQKVGGEITRIKEYEARNGLMAWIDITWNEEVFPVTVFATSYSTYKSLIQHGKPVICRVKRLKSGCSLQELVRLDYL